MCSIVTVDMEHRQNECWQWKMRCALNELSDKFLMEKHCYDISWHRWCGIMNGRRKDIFGNTKTGSLSVRYSDIRIMYNKKQIGRR